MEMLRAIMKVIYKLNNIIDIAKIKLMNENDYENMGGWKYNI